MPVTRIGPADSVQDARELLEKHNYTCKTIVQVDRDSILYLNGLGRPRTAWIHVPRYGPTRVQIAVGFISEPPEGWHDELPGDGIREPLA
jgi:hypothetical protein